MRGIPSLREPIVSAHRVVRVALVAFSALILVVAFLSRLSLFGIRPDVMLLVTVLVALIEGPDSGALAGYACGFGIDLFLDTPLGLSALTYCLVGFAVGIARDRVVSVSGRMAVVLVGLASLVGELLLLVMAEYLGRASVLGPGRAVGIAIVVTFWNLLFMRPAWWLVARGLGSGGG